MNEAAPLRIKHPGETVINPGNLQLQPKFGGTFPANPRVDAKKWQIWICGASRPDEWLNSGVESLLIKSHPGSIC